MVHVFISSPYSVGDTAHNVRVQMDAFNKLVKLGFAPFAPLLAHYQEIVHPLPWETWLKLDKAWITRCDCVLRLPGESKGADEESEWAFVANKPVYKSIDELKEAYNGKV